MKKRGTVTYSDTRYWHTMIKNKHSPRNAAWTLPCLIFFLSWKVPVFVSKKISNAIYITRQIYKIFFEKTKPIKCEF